MLPKLQEMVLLALLRHGPDTTAGDIQATLSEALGREQAFGSIFTTLDRLNRQSLVRWRRGQPDDRRGGRAPRLYTITATGQSILQASLRTTRLLATAVDDQPLPDGALA